MGLKSKLITLCLLVLVGVGVGVAKVGAYTPPEELISIDINNIASINDLTEDLTYQAIAIPKALTVDKMLAFQLVDGVTYMKYLPYIITAGVQDYLFPVINNENQIVEALPGKWWNSTFWSAKRIINDNSPIGAIEATGFVSNDTTAAADIKAIIPIINLAQEYWRQTDGTLIVNNYFLGYFYSADTSLNDYYNKLYNRFALFTVGGYVLESDGYNILQAYINIQIDYKEDADYYYFNTNFEKSIDVAYGNDIATGLKEYIKQNNLEEYAMWSQLLQDAENVAPGVKFVYKTASNIDPESTYQQGYDVGYDVGYQKGVNDTAGQTFSDLGLYDYIYGIFNAMSMLMLIPVGNTQLGYFILIPLIISTVAFIIGIWKGGQRD